MPILYRLAALEDFERLYAVEQACFERPLRFTRSYLRRLAAKKSSAAWMAELDGAVVAFAVVEWGRRRGEIMAYIPTIEVLAEQRRRGLGRELLRKLEASAQAAGAGSIWLHVADRNDGAIRLYEAEGYLWQGRQENYYPDGGAALLFGKRFESVRGQGQENAR